MGNIAKRHKVIIDQLKSDGYVKVQDLSERLGVSEVTIRKDLKYLESKKMLYRNHGSASSLSSIITDKHIDIKEKLYTEEKSRIADAAIKLLEPNDKIIIASGTTLLNFANKIQTENHLTVITSSVKISLTLCYNPNIDIIQLGGTMRRNSVSVVGNFAEEILNGISCNKLFLGVDGIDLDYGLTTSDLSESIINQKMIDAAQEIIILTDSSKFGKRGFCKICNLNKVHRIITDSGAPSQVIDMIRERDIEVTIV